MAIKRAAALELSKTRAVDEDAELQNFKTELNV